jgi:hypothetical protein
MAHSLDQGDADDVFVLPTIESAPRDKARGLKARDIAAAMKAATSVLAGGTITPGEADCGRG